MKQKKRIMAGILGCMLVCGRTAAIPANTVRTDLPDAAQQTYIQDTDTGPGTEQTAEELPQRPEDLAPDWNDPDYVKNQMQAEQDQNQKEQESAQFSLRSTGARKTVSPFTGLTYTHSPAVSDREIVNGIDVSRWQANIDWNKVKKAGVKFAFIRCGYTSLSSAFLMHEDEYFRQNIQAAYNAGIKVGIYFFSNSITTSEAKKEARKTLELINDYKHMITMPVVYDFEAFSSSYRAYGLSKAQVTKNAIAFLDIIQDEGYTPMYYGSPSFAAGHFDVSKLNDYDFWLAHYTTQTSYNEDYVYWQYSSSGQVNGISGNTDCNFFYTNPSGPSGPAEPVDPDEVADNLGKVSGLKMQENTTSYIQIKWKQLEGAQGYKIYRAPALGGTYKEIQVVSGGAITSHLDTTVAESEGRQYYYKVMPYIMEDGMMKYGGESDILTAHTDFVYMRRLKTTANLNLREQAGTEYASSTVVPEGTLLKFKKFTYSTAGTRWYKVTYKKNGYSYTGYLSGNYIKKYTCGTAKKKADIRNGAGTSYKKKFVISAGTDLTILSNKTDSDGTAWSRVLFKQNGKECKGYMKTKLIERY